MSKENKNPKSKVTLFTLIVCVIAVLSGKPISEVVSEISSSQDNVTTEETVNYDYAETLEESVESAIEEKDETANEVSESSDETQQAQEDTATTTDSESTDDEEIAFSEPEVEISDHKFRSKKLLDDHYKKHGLEMGFDSAEEYVENANRVISSPDVLYKLEEEDNDHVYYLEETNEFVVVSQDGYIRTYFNPSAGIDYFNRQ